MKYKWKLYPNSYEKKLYLPLIFIPYGILISQILMSIACYFIFSSTQFIIFVVISIIQNIFWIYKCQMIQLSVCCTSNHSNSNKRDYSELFLL